MLTKDINLPHDYKLCIADYMTFIVWMFCVIPKHFKIYIIVYAVITT